MAFKEACTLAFMAAGLALHLKVEVTAKPEIVETRNDIRSYPKNTRNVGNYTPIHADPH